METCVISANSSPSYAPVGAVEARVVHADRAPVPHGRQLRVKGAQGGLGHGRGGRPLQAQAGAGRRVQRLGLDQGVEVRECLLLLQDLALLRPDLALQLPQLVLHLRQLLLRRRQHDALRKTNDWFR